MFKAKKTAPKSRIIVANWKMNPVDLKEAKKTFAVIKRVNLAKIKDKIVICPPSVYLSELSLKYSGSKIVFGAQDVSTEINPESTGEVSAQILKNLKVQYVIVGHSERRRLGEPEEAIAQKIKMALSAGMKVILCVGEKTRDVNGEYLRFIERQLREDLGALNKKFFSQIIIAYEPIWTIGSGKTSVDGHDLHQMNLFIKKVLVAIFGRKSGLEVPILYGGSVDDENAKQLIEFGEVSGLLIGRASLNPYVFLKILKAIN